MSFIHICRDLYFRGHGPPDLIDDTQSELVRVGISEMNSYSLNKFAGYLIEGQYDIFLWASMLILKYGSPDELLKETCLKAIESCISERYDSGRLRKWITENNLYPPSSSSADN